MFAQVGLAHVGALRKVAQKREDTVKNGAVAATDDIDFTDEVSTACGDKELVGVERRDDGLGLLCAHLLRGAEQDCVGASFKRRAAREREQAAAEFNGGGLFDQALTKSADAGGHRERFAERAVFEPSLRGGLGDGRVHR